MTCFGLDWLGMLMMMMTLFIANPHFSLLAEPLASILLHQSAASGWEALILSTLPSTYLGEHREEEEE